MFRAALLSLALPILTSSVAWSQEPSTREEADRQRREQAAKEVEPYEPNRAERALKFAEDKAIFILDREGFHPKFGTLTTGSGFAYGLGFRDRDLFSNTGALEIWAAGSVKQYWATEARLRFPRLAENRLYSRPGQATVTTQRKTSLASDPIQTETIDPITRSARTISVGARVSGLSRTCSSGAGFIPGAASRRGTERSVSGRER